MNAESCFRKRQGAFYKVELKQYAKRTGEVADGDRLVVYYDKDGLVMSDTASARARSSARVAWSK